MEAKAIYSPYPGLAVKFAYRVPLPSAAASSASGSGVDVAHTRSLITRLYPDYNGQDFLILYPIKSDQEHKQLYDNIARFHYLALRGEIKEEDQSRPLLSRVHLGSPHDYYRFAPTLEADHRIVSRPPVYPRTELTHLLALDRDLMGTVLIDDGAAEGAGVGEVVQLRRRLPPYDVTTDGIYCGDFQEDWRIAQRYGKAGSFDKCRQLLTAQLSSLALSPSSFSFSSSSSFGSARQPLQPLQRRPQGQQQQIQPQRQTSTLAIGGLSDEMRQIRQELNAMRQDIAALRTRIIPQ